MRRTLLIDADLLAYRCSAALQDTIDWNGDGSCTSINGREDEAKRAAENEVDRMMDELKGDDLVICLSDEVQNFRKLLIDPTYKASRSGTERPVHLYDIKDHLAEKYPSRITPTLEADDVMGIMSTEPHTGERVIVSGDKDMKTVPGLLCMIPHWSDPKPKWEVREVSEEEANRFHLWQTLVGDTVDGYPGCPGVGPKGADPVLNGVLWHSWERPLKSGPRKGETVTEWAATVEPSSTPWQRVVAQYAKAGLTEAHALTQARLAFILRHGYLEGRRVKLWEPVYG